MTWMLAAIILSAAYSSTLRATLVLPVVPSPIDTLEQLANSRLSWNMVQYFHPLEKDLETSDDPAKQKIWKEKEIVPYDAWPYERMKRVYDGDTAMLEWKTFDTLMEAAFMLPNGQPLVHVSKTVNLSPGVYSTWGFAQINPWIERFLLHIGNIQEGGIDHKIRKDNRYSLLNATKFLLSVLHSFLFTRQFLKMESLHLLEGVTTPAQALVRGEGDEEVNGLTLEDYLGIFVFFFICIGASLLLFLGEYFMTAHLERQPLFAPRIMIYVDSYD